MNKYICKHGIGLVDNCDGTPRPSPYWRAEPLFMSYKDGSPEKIAYEKREAEEAKRFCEQNRIEKDNAIAEIEKQYKLGGAKSVYENWYCNLEDDW